jgi:dynein heavy chain
VWEEVASSLSRVRPPSVTSNFRIEDLKESLPLVFLITDSQIVNGLFLVYINDMLSWGWIPALFPKKTSTIFWVL